MVGNVVRGWRDYWLRVVHSCGGPYDTGRGGIINSSGSQAAPGSTATPGAPVTIGGFDSLVYPLVGLGRLPLVLQSSHLEVDVADNSGIITGALFGGVVYLAYTQGWLSFLGLTPSMAVATPTTTPIMPVIPLRIRMRSRERIPWTRSFSVS